MLSKKRNFHINTHILNILSILFLAAFYYMPRWRVNLRAPDYLLPDGEISIKNAVSGRPRRFITFYNGTYSKIPKFNTNISLDGINFYPSTLAREYLVMAHIKNVYLSSNGGIVFNNKRVHIFRESTPYVGRWPIAGTYESVIYPYAANGWVSGHWINDGLCGLIQVPKKIFNKSYVIHQFDQNIVEQQFEILGWDKSKALSIRDQWIFVKDAYIVYGLEHLNSLNVAGLPTLSKMFRKRLGLTEIRPFRYCMTNRPKGPRYIRNYKTLIKTAKDVFPEITWQSFVTNEVNISKTGLMYAQCKILLCPCGSNVINTIWMSPGSGICILMANYIDFPNLAWAMVLNIWAVGISNPKWSHFSTGGRADLAFTMSTIKYLIDAVENKAWPNSNNYIDAFELTRTAQRMKGHPELFEYNNGPTFCIAELI